MLTLTRGLLDSSLSSSMGLVPGEASSWVQASPANIKMKSCQARSCWKKEDSTTGQKKSTVLESSCRTD
jgi:hypothetical protein